MNTYEIITTHAVLEVKGDAFERDVHELTGEAFDYQVTAGDKLVAVIAANAFIGVTIR